MKLAWLGGARIRKAPFVHEVDRGISSWSPTQNRTVSRFQLAVSVTPRLRLYSGKAFEELSGAMRHTGTQKFGSGRKLERAHVLNLDVQLLLRLSAGRFWRELPDDVDRLFLEDAK